MLLASRAALALAGIVLLPTAASAVPLIGGDTRVQVDQAFVSFIGGVTGTATVVSTDPLIANFPISGGNLTASLAGRINHEGVGLILTDGTTTAEAGNFTINTVSQLLFGDVLVNGAAFADDVPLFSFDLSTVTVDQLIDLANPQLGLFVTATAAGALETAFGLGGLEGARFGSAATAPVLGVVPEPATWAMMIAGFGLVGASLRRRNQVGSPGRQQPVAAMA